VGVAFAVVREVLVRREEPMELVERRRLRVRRQEALDDDVAVPPVLLEVRTPD
jgi:hypothetical protein